jgi:hypothetical protein
MKPPEMVDSGFVPFTYAELDSVVYRELPANAAKLLMYLKMTCMLETKGALDMSTCQFGYTEAREYGFGNRTFFDSVKDLERNGFIDIVGAGGLGGDGHTTGKYRLADRWLTFR